MPDVVRLIRLTLLVAPLLTAAPAQAHSTTPPTRESPQTPTREVAVQGCYFTLYYFKDHAQRLQLYVPAGYRLRAYDPPTPLVSGEGSATIATVAYACDRIAIEGRPAGPATFTIVSILVSPPGTEEVERPGVSDFYVLWIHADNAELARALGSVGMPSDVVKDMSFVRPLQSLGVQVAVPWSRGAYALSANGLLPDRSHDHANTYWHDHVGLGTSRVEFTATGARDQFCFRPIDGQEAPCGEFSTEAPSPLADLFGATERSADFVFDHEKQANGKFSLSRSPGAGSQRPASQRADDGAGAGTVRLSARPRSAIAGKRTRFRFTATRTAGGRTTPLAGATVRFAGRKRTTDRRGVARFVKRFPRSGRYVAHLFAAGVSKATATVVVRRHRARRAARPASSAAA